MAHLQMPRSGPLPAQDCLPRALCITRGRHVLACLASRPAARRSACGKATSRGRRSSLPHLPPLASRAQPASAHGQHTSYHDLTSQLRAGGDLKPKVLQDCLRSVSPGFTLFRYSFSVQNGMPYSSHQAAAGAWRRLPQSSKQEWAEHEAQFREACLAPTPVATQQGQQAVLASHRGIQALGVAALPGGKRVKLHATKEHEIIRAVEKAAQVIPVDALDTETLQELEVRLKVHAVALWAHMYCTKQLRDAGLPPCEYLSHAIDECAERGLGNVSGLAQLWHAIRQAGNVAKHEFDCSWQAKLQEKFMHWL